ncbi:MAG TPA: M20 family metallo-hydrolase [Desulfomicrobiaceae bacterium]|nr:M20 family metallo-hydrolase [Desulfomicrobiaceae bacterium]
MISQLLEHLSGQEEELLSLQRTLVSIPALGPDNGGDGELEKARFLSSYLEGLKCDELQTIEAPDDRVSCGYRPTLVGRIFGTDRSKTLWIIAHTDIVPTGDLAMWDTDPFELHRDGDLIMGRGVEDNHQGLVSSLLLARGIRELKITPAMNLGLILVADEETGSRYGLRYVMDEHGDMFSKNDLFLIPDYGVPEGNKIEVAEKSMLWLKITVSGRQCHASTPEEGINSLVGASAFILALDRLHETFSARDELFSPAISTFSPTKKEANVPNINTLPGHDVFYLDCRILPQYDLQVIMEEIKSIGAEVSAKYGVSMSYETVQQEQAASATPVDSEIVRRLAAGVEAVYNVPASPMGVGGGTVAAVIRRKGLHAAVWATLLGKAHQPNECASIASTLKDAQVMGHLLLSE